MNLYIVQLYSEGLKNFAEVAMLFRRKNTQEGCGQQSSATRKMLMEDSRCTYQMFGMKELNIGSAAIHKIIHEVETYIPFFDVPIRQGSKVWVFEDDHTPTMVKKQ
ncbi:hypothetical protein TNCV_2628701 [Trichonephila clavipes]|uniref:Uncharacterized protein n=1 Tax=Trichonephila clavipes TaxID=2585209 RepID=A0A8X6SKS4_TRICX|nr:hypothetical protein TNCV_2628701 [Trichonephila clavipes]